MGDDGEGWPELREAVRALCGRFPVSYFREIDQARGYPESFVAALTAAGWLAALIPEEYGGAGLGLGAASVILEEVNRAGGNAGACHGQMYNMGTQGPAAPAGDGRDRAGGGNRHCRDPHRGGAAG